MLANRACHCAYVRESILMKQDEIKPNRRGEPSRCACPLCLQDDSYGCFWRKKREAEGLNRARNEYTRCMIYVLIIWDIESRVEYAVGRSIVRLTPQKYDALKRDTTGARHHPMFPITRCLGELHIIGEIELGRGDIFFCAIGHLFNGALNHFARERGCCFHFRRLRKRIKRSKAGKSISRNITGTVGSPQAGRTTSTWLSFAGQI